MFELGVNSSTGLQEGGCFQCNYCLVFRNCALNVSLLCWCTTCCENVLGACREKLITYLDCVKVVSFKYIMPTTHWKFSAYRVQVFR